jgi:hypothetical protein
MFAIIKKEINESFFKLKTYILKIIIIGIFIAINLLNLKGKTFDVELSIIQFNIIATLILSFRIMYSEFKDKVFIQLLTTPIVLINLYFGKILFILFNVSFLQLYIWIILISLKIYAFDFFTIILMLLINYVIASIVSILVALGALISNNATLYNTYFTIISIFSFIIIRLAYNFFNILSIAGLIYTFIIGLSCILILKLVLRIKSKNIN